MKKILFVLFVSFLSFACFAQKVQNAGTSISPNQTQKEYEFLKEQQKEQLSYIKEQNKSHREFIESERKQYETFLAGLAIIISGLFSFWGFKTRSDVKKISNEQVEKFQKEFKRLEDENLIKINRFNQSVEDKLGLAIKQIDSEISNKLARLLNEDKDVIYDIINKYNEEGELRKNKRILIIGIEKAKNIWFYKLLKDVLHFQYVDNSSEDEIFNENHQLTTNGTKIIEAYDLLIFNNSENNINKENCDALLTNYYSENKVYFPFFFDLGPDLLKTNISSAKMKSQIYSNIMNLLKYQSIVNKS